MAKSASNQETPDQFMSCWEGLDDLHRGNAALHDFSELLVIALCAVLCGGQGAVDSVCFSNPKSRQGSLRAVVRQDRL